MTLWISVPSVFVPEASLSEPVGPVDPLYQRYQRMFFRIYDAFSCSAVANGNGVVVPRGPGTDYEELASRAIKPLLKDQNTEWSPDILVDCRSSAAIGGPAPTYKLAAKVGLNASLPFSLGSQGGTEVAHALALLSKMGTQIGGGAIISAMQRVAPPDSRTKKTGYLLADAAGAIAVSRSMLGFGASFRLGGVAIVQGTGDWPGLLSEALDCVLDQAGATKDSIRWSMAHRYGNQFLSAASTCLPRAEWVVRDLYPQFDFGCVDTLVSLHRLFVAASSPPIGTGVVWFAGRFGTAGAILLNSQSVGLWKQYTSGKIPY